MHFGFNRAISLKEATKCHEHLFPKTLGGPIVIGYGKSKCSQIHTFLHEKEKENLFYTYNIYINIYIHTYSIIYNCESLLMEEIHLRVLLVLGCMLFMPNLDSTLAPNLPKPHRFGSVDHPPLSQYP